MGPMLMFDKSFLEMLSPEEVSELSMYFSFVGTPLLIWEIISDLKKMRKDRRLPEEVVRALASKMWQAHGLQPANFRKLVIANTCGVCDVPMIGQVPVDETAPNVFVTEDGKGVVYDSTIEQEMWQKWANGDFSVDDEQTATLWRAGVQNINLHAVGRNWKQFAAERFGSTRNLSELIAQVNTMLDDFSQKRQFELLVTLMALLDFSLPAAHHATMLFRAGLMPRLKDLAPYAASVLRLYLTFLGGLGRGFVGPRTSHYIDLQYLFYAPFCMAFVSADKFHRELWPATSGVNTFVWGPALKAELRQRVELERKIRQQNEQRPTFPFFPEELQGSVIHSLWQRYIVVPMGDFQPPGVPRRNRPVKQARTIDDLEPEIRDQIKAATRIVDDARRQREAENK